MNELEKLFLQYTAEIPTSIVLLTPSGSNRNYYRLESAHHKLIGVEGTSIDENRAFIAMSDHFYNKGIPVPRVLAKSDDDRFYIQDDLGDLLLFNFIYEGRKTGVFNEEERAMLIKTIRLLPAIQFHGAEDFDFSVCYPQPEFNKRSILWDLNNFKYCFLKSTEVGYQENLLEDDFEKFAEVLLRSQSNTFMYRDFQSRNVMIKNGEPYFIDFQGGRKGPYLYDIVSFLWQAKARFSDELRDELLTEYIEELQKFIDIDQNELREQLNHIVLFRTLQVLGTYGFRGYVEQKPHFLQSIPFAIVNLKSLLQGNLSDYPYLVQVLQQMSELQHFQEVKDQRNLIVTVYSFSYRNGIPIDNSANGGGFVFDCRAVNNPGRHIAYKYFNGLDAPVIRFLEDDGEILTFFEGCTALVDASVKRYKDIGFSNLMVNFGCTGGQHRSVYLAQKMAHHIHETLGVEVKLIHREQNIQNHLIPIAKVDSDN